ncbi:MAG: peptidoglycan-binding protein [Patescibacteria group bacterium]|nr:peptidoglycan-binding protein [Patescibacteria group bacterium]
MNNNNRHFGLTDLPLLMLVLLASVGALVYVASKTSSSPSVSSVSPRTQLAQVSGSSCTTVCGGLVGYWPLDGNANDASGNGNNGTLVGSPTFTTGVVGSGAVSLDGTSQYVTTGSTGASTLNVGSGSFTVSTWIKTSYTSVTDKAIVAKRNNSANTESGYSIKIVNGKADFYFGDGTNGRSDNSSINVADQGWHLLTMVIDRSSNLKIGYVDGSVQVSHDISTIGAQTNTDALCIGSTCYNVDSGQSRYFPGSIDDVRIYNRALSAPEVSSIYQLGSGSSGSTVATYSITVSNNGNGTVTSNPSGISCGFTCSISVINGGTPYTLTASPDSGYVVSWSGCGSSSGNTCNVTVNSDMTVTATFRLQTSTHSITAISGTGGSIFPSGLISVNDGSNQSFTITPDSGYSISSLTVDNRTMSTSTSYAFSSVTADHIIQAGFTSIQQQPTGPQTYYIDYANGSDSNSGLSKSSPWKYAPYMAGFSGKYTHIAGDHFIFKGGVTWVGPSSGIFMNIKSGGSSYLPDYYGVDTTWYTGSSWSRPILDGNSSGSYMISSTNVDNLIFDDWELDNVGNSSGDGYGMRLSGGSNIEVKNMIFNTNAAQSFSYCCIVKNDSNIYVHNNLVENSGRMFIFIGGPGSPTNYVVDNIRIYDNDFEGQGSYSINNTTYHGDGIMIGADGNTTYAMTNLKIYGNIFRGSWMRNTAEIYLNGDLIPPNRITPYFSTNNTEIYDNIFAIEDTSCSTGETGNFIQAILGHANLSVFNNTFSGDACTSPNPVEGNRFDQINNLTIMNNIFSGMDNAVQINPGVTESVTVDNNLFYNITGDHLVWDDRQGGDRYTNCSAMQADPNGALGTAYCAVADPKFFTIPIGADTGDWHISSESAAIGTGVNMTALCSTLPGLCTDIAGKARPSTGPWDIGAYQYSSTPINNNPPPPPPPSPVNGSCSTTLNQCTVGTFYDVTDTSSNYLWSCTGTNGGTTAQCSLPISSGSSNNGNSNQGGGSTGGTSGGGVSSGGADGRGGGSITTGPVISNISVQASSTTAVITWTTSVQASTQVKYGLTYLYGSQSALNTTMVTSHSVTITNLQPNTVYHYALISKDAYGNQTTSQDYTFTTARVGATTAIITTQTNQTNPSNTVPGCPQGITCTPLASSNITPSSSSFTPISIGTTDPVVKTLQQTLNSKGYTVSYSGAGSKGQETSYFGSLTVAALKKYQCSVLSVCSGPSYGVLNQATAQSLGLISASYAAGQSSNTTPTNQDINCPSGYICTKTKGPSTNNQTTTNTQSPIINSNSQFSGTFTRSLTLGSTGSDVQALQVFLNNHGFLVSSTGAGSPGHETTYFGPATSAAVARFQNAYASQILTPVGLTKGTGYFGPSTIKAVNSLQ